ncbi:hypothetical protein INR49_007905 [Caranx melampygus]|nr:hypothetical protein INR49_007905 [Caranx melampygus]
MVSLAHCHSKRGSRRAETAHVKRTEGEDRGGREGGRGGRGRGGGNIRNMRETCPTAAERSEPALEES